MAWTPEKVEILLTEYGLSSASEIAAKTGMTRSAVIGKARRMGLSVPADALRDMMQRKRRGARQ